VVRLSTTLGLVFDALDGIRIFQGFGKNPTVQAGTVLAFKFPFRAFDMMDQGLPRTGKIPTVLGVAVPCGWILSLVAPLACHCLTLAPGKPSDVLTTIMMTTVSSLGTSASSLNFTGP
jgi:hypothetical protein